MFGYTQEMTVRAMMSSGAQLKMRMLHLLTKPEVDTASWAEYDVVSAEMEKRRDET